MGDATGRIVLWHGVRSAVEARVAAGAGANPTAEPGDASAGHNVSRATVHWHAEPVRCLAFSADGTYLLSGASEPLALRLVGVVAVHEEPSNPASDFARACQFATAPTTDAIDACCWLVAGGHEGVLVVWDISSGRRTYLPRLGKKDLGRRQCLPAVRWAVQRVCEGESCFAVGHGLFHAVLLSSVSLS